MTLTLRSTSLSPFVRKVRIATEVLGLSDKIDIRPAALDDDEDTLRRQNPLGKIPTLILPDGRAIYDSRVIMEYLDDLAGGGRLIPSERHARFEALTLAALADGILDAAVLILYEGRYRPDQVPYEPWLERQRGKIERALAALAAAPPALQPATVGTIGVACALGYLDFRKAVAWRSAYPGLVAWLEAFAAATPAFDRTRPDD